MLAALNVFEALSVVAADDPADSKIGPGLVAFLIVALLGVATFLLIRSMLYHLRKVPPTFDDEASERRHSDGDTEGQPESRPSPDGDDSSPGVS